MVVSAGRDRRVIVWRLQVLDFFSEEPELMFNEPRVNPLFMFPPDSVQLSMNGFSVPLEESLS